MYPSYNINFIIGEGGTWPNLGWGGGGGGGRGGGVRRMISKVVLSTILPTTTKQKLSALSSLTKCRTG